MGAKSSTERAGKARSPREPKEPLERAGLALLWLVALGAVVWVVWEFATPWSGERREVARIVADGNERLARAIERADRLDPGWRMEEILARRAAERPPDERNSALRVHEAFSLLPPHWETIRNGPLKEPLKPGEAPGLYRLQSDLEKLAVNEAIPELFKAGLRTDLDTLSAAVDAAERIADFHDGQTSFTLALDPNMTDRPYVMETRSIVRLLDLDVMRRLLDDDPTAAIRSVRAMLNVARSIGDEPFLTSQLVRNANTRLTVGALERTLARSEPPDKDLAGVQERLLEEALVSRSLFALRGERAMLHDRCTKLENGTISGNVHPGLAANEPVFWSGLTYDRLLLRYQHAVLLEMLTDDIEIARRPFHERYDHWSGWETRKTKMEVTPAMARVNEIAVDVTWNATGLVISETIAIANLRCAAVAVAAERYRKRHGHWPEDVGQLVPEFLSTVPLDPFDGQSIRIAATPKGIAVYSVAIDQTDNGGTFDPKYRSHLPGNDVGFWLFDPEFRGVASLPVIEKSTDNDEENSSP